MAGFDLDFVPASVWTDRNSAVGTALILNRPIFLARRTFVASQAFVEHRPHFVKRDEASHLRRYIEPQIRLIVGGLNLRNRFDVDSDLKRSIRR